MTRTNISSGAPWEEIVAYSRAVVTDTQVFISGTTAMGGDGFVVAPGDMHAQTMQILDKIAHVLAQAGSGMDRVVQTRMYVTDISRWEEVARAHREYFHDIRPAATMVEVSRLIHPDMLIEIEVIAMTGQATRRDEGHM